MSLSRAIDSIDMNSESVRPDYLDSPSLCPYIDRNLCSPTCPLQHLSFPEWYRSNRDPSSTRDYTGFVASDWLWYRLYECMSYATLVKLKEWKNAEAPRVWNPRTLTPLPEKIEWTNPWSTDKTPLNSGGGQHLAAPNAGAAVDDSSTTSMDPKVQGKCKSRAQRTVSFSIPPNLSLHSTGLTLPRASHRPLAQESRSPNSLHEIGTTIGFSQASVYRTPHAPPPSATDTDTYATGDKVSGTSSTPLGSRPLSYKTVMCKHWARSKGIYCPLRENCNFIHDRDLLTSIAEDAEARNSPVDTVEWRQDGKVAPPQLSSSSYMSMSPNSSNGKTKKGKAHCWAYVTNGKCEVPSCRFVHPKDKSSYVKYTPCRYGVSCETRSKCPFTHPESIFIPQVPYPLTSPPHQGVATAGMIHPNGTVYYPVCNSSNERVLMLPEGVIPAAPTWPQQQEPLAFTTPSILETSRSSLPALGHETLHVTHSSLTPTNMDDDNTNNYPYQTRRADEIMGSKRVFARRMTVTVVRGDTKKTESGRGGQWGVFHKRLRATV